MQLINSVNDGNRDFFLLLYTSWIFFSVSLLHFSSHISINFLSWWQQWFLRQTTTGFPRINVHIGHRAAAPQLQALGLWFHHKRIQRQAFFQLVLLMAVLLAITETSATKALVKDIIYHSLIHFKFTKSLECLLCARCSAKKGEYNSQGK